VERGRLIPATLEAGSYLNMHQDHEQLLLTSLLRLLEELATGTITIVNFFSLSCFLAEYYD
jgi:hypothetical protein